jgi:hypothetical protein
VERRLAAAKSELSQSIAKIADMRKESTDQLTRYEALERKHRELAAIHEIDVLAMSDRETLVRRLHDIEGKLSSELEAHRHDKTVAAEINLKEGTSRPKRKSNKRVPAQKQAEGHPDTEGN